MGHFSLEHGKTAYRAGFAPYFFNLSNERCSTPAKEKDICYAA